ncbi:hypothetical protein AWV80_08565 [Cupriavidus sp. UYMU48A]|nr:hypothetical protein AWV80_08565 [Cupriavidus sp. UYMU48A]
MVSTLRLSDFRVPGDRSHTVAGTWCSDTARLLRRACAALTLVLACLLLCPGGAGAQVIEATEARIEYQDNGFELTASFDFDLPPALEEALNKGISLYFMVEFQLTRPRWYWFDEKPVNTSRTIRLSYQPLTRQYRVSTGGLQLPFPRLKSALQFIQRVHGWRVFDRGAVKPGESYHAEVRMKLDLSQLPKPFQINAVNTREWNLASDWRRFIYTVPTDLNAPPPAPPAPAPAPVPALPASPVMPASPPVPASAPAASAEPRTGPFVQTVSTALSPAALVLPGSGQP